jgi:hypothetical protein
MNSLSKLALATVITLSSASLALAKEADRSAHQAPTSPIAQNPADSAHAAGGIEASTVEGEIKKVDKEAGHARPGEGWR